MRPCTIGRLINQYHQLVDNKPDALDARLSSLDTRRPRYALAKLDDGYASGR
jgi:hypothetical protein